MSFRAGEYYAISKKCTGRGCKLSSGTLDGKTVNCLCHKSVFKVKTSAVFHRSAAKPDPKYAEKVEEEQILVSVM